MDPEDCRMHTPNEQLLNESSFSRGFEPIVSNYCCDDTPRISTDYSKGLTTKCKKKIVRLWDHLKRRVEGLKLTPDTLPRHPQKAEQNDSQVPSTDGHSSPNLPNSDAHPPGQAIRSRNVNRPVARSKSFTRLSIGSDSLEHQEHLAMSEFCELASSWRLVQAEVKRLRKVRRHSVDASLMAARRIELELTLRDLERHIAVLSCFLQNHPLLEASQGLGMALKSLEEASLVVMRERVRKLTDVPDFHHYGIDDELSVFRSMCDFIGFEVVFFLTIVNSSKVPAVRVHNPEIDL
ncbi:hypothetical protein QAD02_003847 [Eretmocerus hayati]|uniref:Uncharacterized protein n=1 Tax=Eretmocerus hayati TaxID=131215 RepID=A0ACC2NP41_9HYME|nr:hypothetical protein QAD02_003847 [Eretmocerus hayati]